MTADGKKLYVGNLSFNLDEGSLKRAFDAFGEVTSATIIMDKMSGRSRGFGFVEYADASQAQTAIDRMHGTDLDGRALTVNVARDPSDRPNRDGGRGFGGGGGGGRRRF